jgi:hypothetical protein
VESLEVPPSRSSTAVSGNSAINGARFPRLVTIFLLPEEHASAAPKLTEIEFSLCIGPRIHFGSGDPPHASLVRPSVGLHTALSHPCRFVVAILNAGGKRGKPNRGVATRVRSFTLTPGDKDPAFFLDTQLAKILSSCGSIGQGSVCTSATG